MTAPGDDDLQLAHVHGVIPPISAFDLSLVRDPIVQQCLASMLHLNTRQTNDISALRSGQDKIMRMLSKLTSKRSSKPSAVVVRSRKSSSSGSGDLFPSSSAQTSSNPTSGSGSHDDEGLVLECLFCDSVHDNEKSHWQHYDRLGKRIGMAYSGDCVLAPDHAVLRGYSGCDADKMLAFIKEYNSHISSSKEKGINRERASRLAAFLASKLQP
jgi:hypothetical protein